MNQLQKFLCMMLLLEEGPEWQIYRLLRGVYSKGWSQDSFPVSTRLM